MAAIMDVLILLVLYLGMPPPGMPPMMGRGMPPPGMPPQYMHPGMRGEESSDVYK